MKVLLLHTFLTFYMTGVLWLVQRVQYPLLPAIPEEPFKKWHAFHSNRITPVVGPAMVAELVTAALLMMEDAVPFWLRLSLLLLTLAIWTLTFLVSVPLHNRLQAEGREDQTLRRLTTTNWPRTLAYSAKASLLAWFFLR